MWKLIIHQNKELDVNGSKIEVENSITFEDMNPNNLMDLVRYMNECQTPSKTWYTLEDMTIINRGAR